jgi:hypothetical protein
LDIVEDMLTEYVMQTDVMDTALMTHAQQTIVLLSVVTIVQDMPLDGIVYHTFLCCQERYQVQALVHHHRRAVAVVAAP